MTKRERIEELERRVAELEARPATEYHYHYERPALGTNSGWTCPACGAWFAIGRYHACWTVPYWNPVTYGPNWGGGTLTVSGGNTSGITSGYAHVSDALAGIWTNRSDTVFDSIGAN